MMRTTLFFFPTVSSRFCCPGFAVKIRTFCCCRCVLSRFCGLNEDILLLRCLLSRFYGLIKDVLLLTVWFVLVLRSEQGCYAAAGVFCPGNGYGMRMFCCRRVFYPGKRSLPGQKTSSPGKNTHADKKMPIRTKSQWALFICSCRKICS